MIRCIVVDDDADIRNALQQLLQRFGMSVAAAADGRGMRRLLAVHRYDVAVLDLMLPDENGLALCRWVQSTHDLPVIMLTAHGDPASRVLGLEMGADDYLGKPFEPRELVARIHAVLRRVHKRAPAAEPQPASVAFDGWRFERTRHQLLSPRGLVVALSQAEYRLLSAFVERPRRVLTREQLIEQTRASGVEVNDRSIDLAVSRLRQKLDEPPRAPRLIRTVRGEGYCFDAEVQR
ncbi:MAG TPA: response regulator transcription factor [Methylibium sp.]|uniref:response regulator transcription factor n=1 Tax=Methylibium sp. TaxID=2067992 RepID=UPI002DBD0924|nr:response regulator transcription factor [Methylibium sp.]HEU4459758.1 response regulator transcription factor [Methylibium sp.]